MIDLFVNYCSWCWVVGGLVLVGAEMLLPGFFLLWIGFAAILVGALSFLLPLSLYLQFILFAFFSPLMMILGKKYLKTLRESDSPLLNERSKQMIGRVIVLNNPIVDGRAQVAIGDSVWMVEGPDLDKGSHVIVIGVEGNRLKVVPLDTHSE